MTGEFLISPCAAWLTAQFFKSVIYSIKNRRISLNQFWDDGGMPSAHSALVTSLAVACLLCVGPLSVEFAIAAVMAVIVMHDASGVRFESGRQAKAINELHDYLQSLLHMPTKERLDEILGHTPFQVFMGALTGAVVAVIVHII